MLKQEINFILKSWILNLNFLFLYMQGLVHASIIFLNYNVSMIFLNYHVSIIFLNQEINHIVSQCHVQGLKMIPRTLTCRRLPEVAFA